jgi:hypothetical protein
LSDRFRQASDVAQASACRVETRLDPGAGMRSGAAGKSAFPTSLADIVKGEIQ